MGIGIKELLIVLVIVVVIFGTKRFRSMGGDIGEAIKGFRKAMKDEEKGSETKPDELPENPQKNSEESVTDKEKTR